jgi:predicted outer membrane repeat protein
MQFVLRIGLIVVMIGLMVVAKFEVAFAAGVVGDGTPGSCTEAALNAALVGGGDVSFNCGGPKAILITTAKTIALDTTISGGDEIILTGGLATRLFTITTGATLVLQDIVLDSAFSNGADGGAIANDGTLYLTNSTIQFSQTDINHSGGAIFTSGPVFITNSTLRENKAGSGGAIFANFGNAKVTINGSTVTKNQALNTTFGYGGGIWVGSQAELAFNDGDLSGNGAQLGGAIYASPDTRVTIAGSYPPVSFIGNKANVNGGALYNEGGTLALDGTSFVGNAAPVNTIGVGYGGAIANLGMMTLENAYFNLNEGRFGGAVFVGGSVAAARATINNTVFSRNTAGVFGGGLYANVDTTAITVTDSLFNLNVAELGGGIARFNAQLRLRNSSLTENTATSAGGLYIGAGPQGTEGGYVLVRDTTISTNTATGGQGGALHNQGLVDLSSVTIKDNSSGIFNSGTVEATRIHNSVLQNPAGLNCDGDGTLPQSDGGNLVADMSCAFTFTGDQQGAGLDPKLGPLTTDSFGVTRYHMPASDSPLINGSVLTCSQRDQRHALRPDRCDIGAVEYGGLLRAAFLPLVIK